ncbi:MAG: metallophosphoesterase [Pseudorhodoplanes sp.]|nr:metallophosphoesterase [Pseudorhodoplanes sp.]
MNITRRLLLLGSSCLAMLTGLPRFAAAQSTTVTFVLVNDIYLMNEETGPDGRKRGGFPRLAAVVKAERARAAASGGHVIFAHAGDTLSPSLLSGIDRGYHIVALINMILPDIFVPGNHEFDFGKEVFLQRMREARFPALRRQHAQRRRPAAARIQRPRHDRDRRRAHRPDRRGADRDAAGRRFRRHPLPLRSSPRSRNRRRRCAAKVPISSAPSCTPRAARTTSFSPSAPPT